MRINRIEIWPWEMRLREPYTIAYETVEKTTNVFIRLETNTGLVAYGCAAPDEPVTGEKASDVLAALREVATPLLEGADPLRRLRLLVKLKQKIPDRPSARAAVDMALHDLLGKAAGQPLWRVLGGYRDRILTSITIGIMGVDETAARARQFVQEGFRAVKIKTGSNLEEDIDRVFRVREVIGAGVALRCDANQGYSASEAIEFCAPNQIGESRDPRAADAAQPTRSDGARGRRHSPYPLWRMKA